jgi:pilus assembly protein Flp/PilA
MSRLLALRTQLHVLASDRRGVSAVEYALVAALIAAVIIGVVTTLGTNVSTVFNNVATSI